MKRIKKLLKKLGNKKVIIISIVVTFIIVAILLVINILNMVNKDDNTNDDIVVEKIDQMENYDYYLDENATEYYKELYNELKNVLNNEEVNDEEYAKVVSKLFVTDLFTLDNKITSSDIGGLQFVYADFKEDFLNIAKSTLYSSVESNIYGDRQQELPIVSNVEINSISGSNFNYAGTDYSSYDTVVSITYQSDLGYPTNYQLTLIKNDKYFQVVAGK